MSVRFRPPAPPDYLNKPRKASKALRGLSFIKVGALAKSLEIPLVWGYNLGWSMK